jgi:hypothetical protein
MGFHGLLVEHHGFTDNCIGDVIGFPSMFYRAFVEQAREVLRIPLSTIKPLKG